MKLYESSTWLKDLDEEISLFPELDKLSGRTILITGATGLICSALVDLLIRYNETHEDKVGIIVAGRSLEKVKKRFGPYSNREYFNFSEYDATSIEITIEPDADYIIHGASNAYPSRIMREPVETMMSNFVGTKVLLDYAKENNAKKFLLISSSEVYGKKDNIFPSKENEYGGLDPTNARNSYSVGKLASETLCASYYDEYGVEYAIVRPGHIYGPTASVLDNRVSSIWAYEVAKGNDITMKSDGAQMRSYCYCLDCATAILKVLLDGKCGQAYNVSNPESIISIREMAVLLASCAGVRIKEEKASEKERKGFNPMSNSSLDSQMLLNLGWKSLFSAEKGFLHTVTIMRECME